MRHFIFASAGGSVVLAVVLVAGEPHSPLSSTHVERPQRVADSVFAHVPQTPEVANASQIVPWNASVHLRSSVAARGIHGDPDPRRQRVDYLAQGPTRFESQPLLAADIPGNRSPDLLQVEEVDIPPETDIIGIAVNDQCHAYLVEALSLMQDHVVNELIANVPISVTYCNLADCARVLTTTTSQPAIDLRIGGLLNAGTQPELVLLLEGIRYRQNSRELPLQDHDFDRTNWREWTRQHPHTVVFIGEMNRYRRKPVKPEKS